MKFFNEKTRYCGNEIKTYEGIKTLMKYYCTIGEDASIYDD